MAKNKEIKDVSPDSKIIQGRNFTYIAYPESMPSDLFELLLNDSNRSQSMSNPYSILISPLHDSDIDEYGKLKKPHYHIQVMYKSDITLSGAKRWGELRGLVMCEKCGKRGLARYLCHLDDKDKHLYDISDVKAINCNYLDIIGSSIDKYGMFREIIEFCNSMGILFYCDLMDYCKDNNDDWFRFLCSGGTFTIEKYLKDKRNKLTFKPEY